MGCDSMGTWYNLKPQTFTASTNSVDFPLDPLAAAIAGAKAPRITRAKIKITMTATTAASTGSARGELHAQCIGNLFLRDFFGARINNYSGAELLAVSKLEFGAAAQDPPALGAGETITSRESNLWLPIGDLPRSVRPQDWRVDARHMVEGGQLKMNITVGAHGTGANTLTSTSVTIEPWFKVVDEKKDVAKIRTIWDQVALNNNFQSFGLGNNALLRWAIQYIGDVGANKVTRDTWAAQDLISRFLGLVSTPEDLIVDDYYYLSAVRRSDAAGILASEDPVALGLAIPLAHPAMGQSFTELPIGDPKVPTVLDWRTSISFASGTFVAANLPKMLLNYVEDRPDEKCGNNEVSKAVLAANGAKFEPASVNPRYVRKLPVQVERTAIG